MAKRVELYFDSADGKSKIYVAAFLPEKGEVKAVLQIAHGISEHIHRYAPFMEYMAEQGFAVFGNDHLGHGKSVTDPANKGFFAEKNGWEIVVEDMHRLYEKAHAAYADKPYFLLGHSMGSFLARTYLIRYPGQLTGAILSGTGHQPTAVCAAGSMLTGLLALVKGKRARSPFIYNMVFGGYTKRIPQKRTDMDWLCTDPAVVDAYVADPTCGGIPSLGLLRDMMKGMQYIADEENLLKMQRDMPVYFFAGEEDPVGAYGAGVRKAKELFELAGCSAVSLRLYPEGRHEMLNETNKEEVWADVCAFMDGVLQAK